MSPSEKDIKRIKQEAPKAAQGGTVTRGGLAEIHQAEIITPRKTVDKQVRLLSAIHGLMEQQGLSLDSLVSQYEDPASKAGGFFATLNTGIEFMLGPIFRGRYTRDIQRSKNPLVTMSSGIIQMHNWQRLYGVTNTEWETRSRI
jgi:hypothetical protein